jgi:cytochrome P450
VSDLSLPFRPFYYISDAEIIEDILVKSHAKTLRSDLHRLFALVTGNGLIASDGDFWKQQRKIIQPKFSKKSTRAYAPLLHKLCKKALDAYEEKSTEFDISPSFFELSIQFIMDCIIGKLDRDDWSELNQLFVEIYKYLELAMTRPIPIPSFVPSPVNLKLKKLTQKLDDEVKLIVEELSKKGSHEDSANMVHFLKTAPHQNEKTILSEVKTIFVAGHETTSASLCWAFVTLGKNPQLQDDLYKSLENVNIDDWEGLLDHDYLEAFVLELLRLYPAAWTFSRKTTDEITFKNLTFPKNSTLVFDLYHAMRDERFFKRPHTFEIDRFMKNKSEYPKHYIPFGAGPRLCIGNNLSVVELKIFLGQALKRFEIKLGPSYIDEVKGVITIHPKYGVPVILKKRK